MMQVNLTVETKGIIIKTKLELSYLHSIVHMSLTGRFQCNISDIFLFEVLYPLRDRGTQRQFSKNICSEDDLRSRIFGTFVVKFLACLPVLGFSNI